MYVAHTTTPDLESARKIAKELVENDIIACANILRIEQSLYKWKGKLVEEPEFLIMMKLKKENYRKLEELLVKIHPYDVPELIAFEVRNSSENYRKWVYSGA